MNEIEVQVFYCHLNSSWIINMYVFKSTVLYENNVLFAWVVIETRVILLWFIYNIKNRKL